MFLRTNSFLLILTKIKILHMKNFIATVTLVFVTTMIVAQINEYEKKANDIIFNNYQFSERKEHSNIYTKISNDVKGTIWVQDSIYQSEETEQNGIYLGVKKC